jgi:hypothetical protein
VVTPAPRAARGRQTGVNAIIPAMSDTPPPVRPIVPPKVSPPDTDKMICERCGKAEMYRMHAVWRCPECGFKTDCCGW